MIAAVESGADVCVQKPISVDVVEGQAMVAAARKHKRVVQVGTQRRSTPHLVEAQDRVIDDGQLGKIGHGRNLLLLPHARQRQPAGQQAARVFRLRDVDRPGAAAALRRPRTRITATRCRIAAGGGRSWNTATASSATCASTCSTWSAGCSTSAGRSTFPQPAASSCRKAASRTSPTRSTATFDFGDFQVVWTASHLGRIARPGLSVGRDFLRREGDAQGEREQLRVHPVRRKRPAAQRHAALRGRQVSRRQNREGPGAPRRLGDSRQHWRTSCIAVRRARSRSPTSNRDTSRRRVASWRTSR